MEGKPVRGIKNLVKNKRIEGFDVPQPVSVYRISQGKFKLGCSYLCTK